MRLDHLLSREKSGEGIPLDPEVEGAGAAKAEAGAETAREKDESPTGEEPEWLLRNLSKPRFCIVLKCRGKPVREYRGTGAT